MTGLEFMEHIRALEQRPVLLLFNEARRNNESALCMETEEGIFCVEQADLKPAAGAVPDAGPAGPETGAPVPRALRQLGPAAAGCELRLPDLRGGRGVRQLAEDGHPQEDFAGRGPAVQCLGLGGGQRHPADDRPAGSRPQRGVEHLQTGKRLCRG